MSWRTETSKKNFNLFFEFSHYRDYDGRVRNIGFLIKSSFTKVSVSIRTLMDEIKPVVSEKKVFDSR